MNSENNTFIAHISHLPSNITTKSILEKLSNDGKFVFKDYDFNNLRRYVNITFETQEEYDDFFKYILELSPPKEDSEKKEKITDYSQLKIAKYVPKEERGRTMEVGGNKKTEFKIS